MKVRNIICVRSFEHRAHVRVVVGGGAVSSMTLAGSRMNLIMHLARNRVTTTPPENRNPPVLVPSSFAQKHYNKQCCTVIYVGRLSQRIGRRTLVWAVLTKPYFGRPDEGPARYLRLGADFRSRSINADITSKAGPDIIGSGNWIDLIRRRGVRR